MADRYFSTGSRRDCDDSKPKFSRLMWTALEEVARVHEYGDSHYGRGNWRKGQPITSTIDSGMRHAKAVLNGEDRDPKTNLLHAAHAAWNMLLVVHQQLHPAKYAALDDRMNDFGDWICKEFAETDAAKQAERGKEPESE